MRKTNGPITMVAAVLALTALGGAIAACRADIGPPVSVRLLGGPHYAKPGERFSADVQVVADAGVRVSGFRLEGEGWERAEVEAPASTALVKSARMQVRIGATSQDPNRPLVLAFEVDGRTMRQSFDLSEAHHRLMSEGGKTRAVPAGEQKAAPVPPLAAGGSWADLGADAVTPPPAGEKSYNITVTGTWYCANPAAGWTGVDGVTVDVMLDGATPAVLASVRTDVNGDFSATFNWSGAGYPNIYVLFKAQNSRLAVKDGTHHLVYAWRTGTWYEYAGTNLDVGGLTSGDESLMPVLNIMTWLTRAWRWYNSYGYDTPYTDVFWIPGTGNVYCLDGLHIGDPWHEGGYCHEYTHHWQYVFAPIPSSTYCNGICDQDTALGLCSHCTWCEENATIAMGEGLPSCIGDVLPRTLSDLYNLPYNAVDNMETTYTCGGTWANPEVTEGFMAALLRDLYDTSQDTHAGSSYPDALAIGADEFLDITYTYNPSTPTSFLSLLMAHYPAINKEDLWSTAINCRFDIDGMAPPVVTNLRSTSHTVNVASPDGTIAFAWTRAADDVSGVDGYGVFVTHSPMIPSPVLDIGDVTSWTTATLAPGTWYFCIRSHDRAGKWGSTYASCGPYVIREAEPADLQPYASAGWARPVVPRATNDAAFTSVPLPTGTLSGNSAATYLNYCGRNWGETATSGQLSNTIRVDGDSRLYMHYASVGASTTYYSLNAGPYNITGGRHTVEAAHDYNEQIQESNETNNRWAHQWVWTTPIMTIGTQYTRDAPPGHSAGWDAVTDGSTLYYNCDGLHFATARYADLTCTWDAVCVYAVDNVDDYDCQLHTHSTGADNGFAASLGSSMRAAGYLDAVLVNGNQAGVQTWDIGVVNMHGGIGDYRAEWTRATSIGLDDSVTVAVAASKMLVMRWFDVAAADTGYYSCTITVSEPTNVWSADHYLPSISTGALSQYTDHATTVAGTGTATIDMHVTQTGRHALAVYRDPCDGADAVTVTIELERTPPDFTPYLASGWAAPVVPRPAADGTPTLVAEPDTLYGNAAATYLNYCWTNDSPNGWPSGGASIVATVHLDGTTGLGSVGWSSAGPHWVLRYNQTTARTIRGGAHTIAMVLDAGALIGERSETNNISGAQYFWSPYLLEMGTAVNRSVPPDRTGGWNEITSGQWKWYNCDGLRMPSVSGEHWRAAGIMSGPDTDVDLRLHHPLYGATSGFKNCLIYSNWGAAQSDIVLVNGHPLVGTRPVTGPFDLGVTLASGLRGYGGEAVTATALTPGDAASYGPYTLAAQHVLQLYELWLTPGPWTMRLDSVSGTVNWGLSIYAPDQQFKQKSSAMEGGIAYLDGAGQDEELTVTVPTEGWYALAVWKVGALDLGLAGTYRLWVRADMTAVPGEAPRPAATALVGIHPNPFNPQTTIDYELGTAGLVRLEIYDLRGTRVRELVAGDQPAGRHAAVWNGRDDDGQLVASGVYMARLAAGKTAQMKKLVLLK